MDSGRSENAQPVIGVHEIDSGRSENSQHVIEVRYRQPGNRKVCDESGACGLADAGKRNSNRSASARKLLIAVVLCAVFMSAEVVGGIKANSLAILTDAAHLLSDVAAFAISLFSLWASGWEANSRQSYGFFRIEILGALVSIELIWLIAGILVYEATNRFIHGNGEVKGWLMFAVAACGLGVNIVMALVLGHHHHHHHHNHTRSHDQTRSEAASNVHQSGDHHHFHTSSRDQTRSEAASNDHQSGDHHHHHTISHDQTRSEAASNDHQSGDHQGDESSSHGGSRNINVQAAYLHVLGDGIQSIGVMIGGGIIWWKPEWKRVDLICTLAFSVIVLATTIKMMRNILAVLMESTPREIDSTRLERELRQMEEVVAIHELHIWAITVGKVLLSCHVQITPEAEAQLVLDKVVGYIKSEYKISHVTIQIEKDYNAE